MAPQCCWVCGDNERNEIHNASEDENTKGEKKNKSTIYTLYAWIRLFRNSSAKGKCYLKCKFEGLIYLCLARGQGIQYVIGPKRVQLN